MSLHLVRHGAPLVDRRVPAREWQLDPASYDAVWALRERLPPRPAWFSSAEPKALQTAQLLTDSDIGVVPELGEHVRESTTWFDDFPGVVRAAFAQPEAPAHPGWEPLRATRERLAGAVAPILAAHREEPVVLVGHGTAWTLLVSMLTGDPPDLDRWAAMGLPDVVALDRRAHDDDGSDHGWDQGWAVVPAPR
jgi:broad specificity phosphatase PhoE